MEKTKDILDIWKERIDKENKRGDKNRACKNTGISFTTYQTGIKKAAFDDLTDSEVKVLAENIKILDERKEKKLKYASN